MFEKGKIYRLSFPTDGLIEQTVKRFPIGLPVKFVAQREDRFEVVEPRGKTVFLPLKPVWRLGRNVDIFADEPVVDEITLEPYPNEEQAEKEWHVYAHPDENRWYVDKLRDLFGRHIYCDWECGWDTHDLQVFLKAAQDCIDLDGEQLTAVLDIAFGIFSGDFPGWTNDVDEAEAIQIATAIIMTVHDMLSVRYFVKTGGHWNLKEGSFEHDSFKVTADTVHVYCPERKTLVNLDECKKCNSYDTAWGICRKR